MWLLQRQAGPNDHQSAIVREQHPCQDAKKRACFAPGTSITLLRYGITLAYRTDDSPGPQGSLEIITERLVHINLGEALQHLPFPHKPAWRKSAVLGRRAGDAFISTEGEGPQRVIKRHQDGKQGRPLTLPAANLPRTVLSAANAAESPTALLARREMQSWRLIQLEPTSLRRPDEFGAPNRLGVDGSHLPATLYRLARADSSTSTGLVNADDRMMQVYRRVANRLSGLVSDIQSVHVDRDEKRELLTVQVTDRSGTSYPARALSDGTLRFLALAILDLEPSLSGLLCFEEPENGIHPERIPAILRLLQDIAVDADWAIDSDNPLRQVIINTHSPAVVSQIPDDALLVAEPKETLRSGQRFKRVCFNGLPDTWRTTGNDAQPGVARGQLLAYLNPTAPIEGTGTRVIDRVDLQLMLPHFGDRVR
jgi:predicted ATPase